MEAHKFLVVPAGLHTTAQQVAFVSAEQKSSISIKRILDVYYICYMLYKQVRIHVQWLP